MTAFTKLEWEAFAALAEEYPEHAEGLQRLLSGARVTERDNTGHGFYTTFDVDRSAFRPFVVQEYPKGPLTRAAFEVRAGDHVFLMGFNLWFSPDMYPHQLEAFQYDGNRNVRDGASSDSTLDLKLYDLAALYRWSP